uniref:Uncharacterized protein n=1 Tax=Magallana gigas TaxID=29159 RepID=A0A8W8NSN9_MAGGI
MQQLLPDEQFLAKAYHFFSDNDATPHNPVLDKSLIPQDDRNACGLPIQLNVSRVFATAKDTVTVPAKILSAVQEASESKDVSILIAATSPVKQEFSVKGKVVSFLQPHSDISSEEDIPEEENNHVGQIYGIQNIYTYRCCINEKCTKKKINEMMTCTYYHIKYSDTSAGYAVVVKLLMKNSRNNMQIFTDAIEQLFTSIGKTANFFDAVTLLQTFNSYQFL